MIRETGIHDKEFASLRNFDGGIQVRDYSRDGAIREMVGYTDGGICEMAKIERWQISLDGGVRELAEFVRRRNSQIGGIHEMEEFAKWRNL